MAVSDLVATGLGRGSVIKALRGLMAEGRLVVQMEPRPSLDGKQRPVPVYSLKKS